MVEGRPRQKRLIQGPSGAWNPNSRRAGFMLKSHHEMEGADAGPLMFNQTDLGHRQMHLPRLGRRQPVEGKIRWPDLGCDARARREP